MPEHPYQPPKAPGARKGQSRLMGCVFVVVGMGAGAAMMLLMSMVYWDYVNRPATAEEQFANARFTWQILLPTGGILSAIGGALVARHWRR